MNDKLKDSLQLPSLPLLAVRDVIVYPYMQIALFVGRAQSLKAIDIAKQDFGGTLFVVSQEDSLNEDIDVNNLYQYGTVCRVISTMPHESDENCLKVLIEGIERARLIDIKQANNKDGALTAIFDPQNLENSLDAAQTDEQKSQLLSLFEKYGETNLRNIRELLQVAVNIDNLLELTYFIATRVALSLSEKQEILDSDDLLAICQRLQEFFINNQTEQSIENQLQESVRKQMENNHREYFLNEKMKAIKSELSDLNNGADDEDGELETRLKEADLPQEVRKKAETEFKKLKMMPSASSEASVVRGYVEWILDTPWNKSTKVAINLAKAKETLDKDHYGLDDVKDRILEYLAVQSRVDKIKGPILCLVGPPGVGKTSLGESIARATGRKFVRMALGGVRDEAEIRGHRRTYIGALPGRMIQGLKNVGTKNPVFLLDEIDKLASDYKGDPSSALLEVLDPEQNSTFSDHFIEVPFDFSEVFWITTANVASNIPGPLLDRMEIIELSSYMEEEKLEIAKRYLTPKQIKKNGLEDYKVKLSDAVLRKVISEYTREAGVRTLEKTIAKICRKIAFKVVEEGGDAPKVTTKNLHEFLGAPIFVDQEREKKAQVGYVNGLAWTSVGGVVLPCEATTMNGTGKLALTGSLGKVMQESGQAAMSYIRHNAKALKIEEDFYKKLDIHVHLPEGATPKDGPSAGITMTLAMVSILTNRKVRSDIAMTGEITLRGRVLPIGGLKEKLLAALSHGIKEVLIPKGNEKDIAELPDIVKEGLIITPVKTMDEVLAKALV